jgi:DNA replication and repair protein RecF
MHVSALSLRDFRSYEALDLRWDPGVVVLLGANGQGKTNIVEALTYLSTLTSHRVATDGPLVRAGASRAQVAARLVDGERSLTVEVDIWPGSANKARINRVPARAPREVLGLARTVLFAPEDLAIVKGDPGERRRFLDALLVQRRPRLAGVRADYDRVLKQRTALLRSAASVRRQRSRDPVDIDTLAVWDGHLARLGAALVAARVGLVDDLEPRTAAAYADLAPGADTAWLTYRSSACAHGVCEAAVEAAGDDATVWEQLLRQAVEQSREAEIDRGQCLVGPHRDDLLLRLGSLPARGYASQGESWSLAVALRLASYDLLRADADTAPVLMLDDVFAELDSRRREHLAERVADADQVVVTAAVPDDVPVTLAGMRFTLAQGEVQRVGPS